MLTPVRPPTMSLNDHERPRSSQWLDFSVDCFLQFLHWKAFHCLARRLGLEDAWLLGEWIHSLAGWCGRLLLELHVEDTTEFEFAVLLQLTGCQLHIACDGCLHLLGLELSGLSDSCKRTTGCQAGLGLPH